MQFAYLLATNPEAFEIIYKDNIILLHGTNCNALPNILRYGMNSVDELEKIGIKISTGEAWSRQNGKRNFISFTDSLSTACGYASVGEMEGIFGTVIGISANSQEQLFTTTVGSDLPELGVLRSVPLEHIKMILVPKNKVKYVRKLVGDNKISVAAIDIEDPFYNIEQDYSQMITYLSQQKEKSRDNAKLNKTFNKEEIKEFSCKRMTAIIKDLYKKIRENSNYRKENDEKNSR